MQFSIFGTVGWSRMFTEAKVDSVTTTNSITKTGYRSGSKDDAMRERGYGDTNTRM